MILLRCPQDRTTPLYMACQKGHSDIVEILIRSGANVHLPRDVCSLLHCMGITLTCTKFKPLLPEILTTIAIS